jgi:L-threonylcarbamoyladenylate synthase
MKTKIINISSTPNIKEELQFAAQIIRQGGLVVFPTETVYGLGGDATDPEAACKIYNAKGRPSNNPLIIHISDPKDAERYAVTSEYYYRLAKAFMPGPLTVILPSKDTIPKETRASLPTVAVRRPEHPIARTLIELSGVPVAAPSANLSGSPSPTRASHVIDDMLGRVDIIIDGGNAEFGLESTIVKIDNDGEVTLLRPGKITVDDLLTVVDEVKIADAVTAALREGERVLSPGMKYKHYAPKSPVYLLDADSDKSLNYIAAEAENGNVAAIVYSEEIESLRAIAPKVFIYDFGKKSDEQTHARVLFDILRDTDKHNFDKIFAPLPNQSGVGLALYNRLIRAAAYQIIRM